LGHGGALLGSALFHLGGAALGDVFLVGRLDHDQAAIGPGDRSLDQDDMVFAVNSDYAEVADGDTFGAIMAGHADSLLWPAATAVAGIGGDATVLPVAFLDAVAAAQAAKIVPLHDTREATALAGANDIDCFDILEHIGSGEHLAYREIGQGG